MYIKNFPWLDIQELLSLTCEERSRVPGDKGGHISKAKLRNIGRP